ncbi:hypothetical protein VTL71DRAFT_194 [Oculimacula yallundae]|uniref:Uncharacterized protein n=1 Tax=Oculimacula yallundae TaxID=86028 RepID=A0ABR4CZG3_9HELO
MSSYPTTEGLQHIAHDRDQYSALHYDDRTAFQRDGIQAYDKQALAYSQAPEYYKPVTTNQQKRICGLSKKTFLIVLAVILLVILAGAVGGGVGGALASKNSNKSADLLASQTSGAGAISSSSAATVQSTLSSTTTSSTSTTSAPSTSSTSPSSTSTITKTATTTAFSASTPTSTAAALVVLGCPAANGTLYTPPGTSSSFLKYCMRDLQSPSNAVVDISNRLTNNFNECIAACVEYTDQWIEGGKAGVGPCAGVAFNTLIPSWTFNNMRCYLKAENGGGKLGFQNQQLENVMASAILVSDS